MASETRFTLKQDRNGMIWDLLLYIPTVAALLAISASAWYEGNPNLSYLLLFLASFFFIAGASRILKTRLMLLPSSPVAIETGNQSATLFLRNGQTISLLKEVKLYKDLSGKTFGLTGMDEQGKRLQFVFHKGQFALERDFQAIQKKYGK
jgi:hypothetical protein